MPAEEQDSRGSEPPSGRPSSNLVRLFAAALELPFMLVAGVVIGGAMGWWLDRKLGTSPWVMLILGALGFAAGLREILRKISKDNV